MQIIHSTRQMQKIGLGLKNSRKTVGFVPTMGALHAGHLSLITRARQENDFVIVSVFVNPAQFGPSEDYLRYPRPFSKDKKLCLFAGVDYLFAPSVKDMYPDGYLTYVNVEKMSELLCGKFRPGHFRGVATVVTKLFNITAPTKAYFGCKDYQQLKIIERMVSDLNFPIKIVPCRILREKEGLAMSSRNQYLSQAERKDANKLSEVLKLAKELILKRKTTNSREIKKMIEQYIKTIPNSKIDYIEVCNPDSIAPVEKIRLPIVILLAVWINKTRLIDNLVIHNHD